jgi:hypothetical protein
MNVQKNVFHIRLSLFLKQLDTNEEDILRQRPSYVDSLINISERAAISKIRTSAHLLMLERHKNIPTSGRFFTVKTMSSAYKSIFKRHITNDNWMH